jgi:thymidylate synthase
VHLPIPSQHDCATAWLEAVKLVDSQPGHEAHNVVIDITNPIAGATLANPIVACVDGFLVDREKSVECIANTIFPQTLYQRYGADKFIDVFHKRVLPKVRKTGRWSGYYFERMTNMPTVGGGTLDQLSRMVGRIQDKSNTSLNKHELSLFDPERDVTGSPYGGQCLSFLSFHLLPGTPKTLLLTAQYRNHYYIEKLLGNLIGLGRLMAFVATETGANVGALTVLSTHATIDQPNASRQQITTLLELCAQSAALKKAAA